MDGSSNILFIVGVQKCGTSTLFDILSRHSQITPSKFKESQFFALHSNVVSNNFSWYEGLFKEREGSIFLDGSTFYFSSEQARTNISHFVEDPRIIIMIRDPVQRAYSAHAHMKRKFPSRDLRSFDEIVKAIKHRSEEGRTLRTIEDEILREAVQDEKIDAEYLNESYLRELFDAPFDSRFEDPLWPYRYFEVSKYHRNVEQFQKIFGASRVKVIVFEELVARPSRIIKEILDFLGLPVESSRILTLPHKNRTVMPSGRIGRGLIWLRRNSDVASEIWRQLRSTVGPLADFLRNEVWKPKPQLSERTYDRARGLLESEYAYWEKRIDCIKSMWTYDSK